MGPHPINKAKEKVPKKTFSVAVVPRRHRGGDHWSKHMSSCSRDLLDEFGTSDQEHNHMTIVSHYPKLPRNTSKLVPVETHHCTSREQSVLCPDDAGHGDWDANFQIPQLPQFLDTVIINPEDMKCHLESLRTHLVQNYSNDKIHAFQDTVIAEESRMH